MTRMGRVPFGHFATLPFFAVKLLTVFPVRSETLIAKQQLHTYCAMCTSRCGVLATVEEGRLTQVTADRDHPNGCVCVKGTAAPEIVYSADRLLYPLVRSRPKGEQRIDDELEREDGAGVDAVVDQLTENLDAESAYLRKLERHFVERLAGWYPTPQ